MRSDAPSARRRRLGRQEPCEMREMLTLGVLNDLGVVGLEDCHTGVGGAEVNSNDAAEKTDNG